MVYGRKMRKKEAAHFLPCVLPVWILDADSISWMKTGGFLPSYTVEASFVMDGLHSFFIAGTVKWGGLRCMAGLRGRFCPAGGDGTVPVSGGKKRCGEME